MALLNSTLEFANAPPGVKAAFLGRWANKTFLPAGTPLYKYTQYPLVSPKGTITPWWSLVDPQAPDDPGLAVSQQRARGLGVTTPEFSRARSAVTKQWNSMNKLLQAKLLQPVWGFAGRCSGQLLDETISNVVLIGGAHQLWIPNLTPAHIH